MIAEQGVLWEVFKYLCRYIVRSIQCDIVKMLLTKNAEKRERGGGVKAQGGPLPHPRLWNLNNQLFFNSDDYERKLQIYCSQTIKVIKY